jgi:hypothetical protein
MKIKAIAFVFVVALALSGRVFGQASGMDFHVGARNASLANANIAESADITVIYENPAALAFLDNGSVFINYSQGNGPRGKQENLAVPLLLKSPVAIALGLNSYHLGYSIGSSKLTDVLEYGYGVVMAATVTPTLSIGGTAALSQSIQNGGAFSGGSRGWGADFEFGADYAPTPDISYSLVFSGLGSGVFYSPGDSALTAASDAFPRTLEVGATMSYPSSASLRPPFLILSFANEKVFGVKGLYYKGGIAIRPLQYVELRFGYLAGPSEFSARYGVGFLWSVFSFQYAIYPQFGTRILIQQFSASMEF